MQTYDFLWEFYLLLYFNQQYLAVLLIPILMNQVSDRQDYFGVIQINTFYWIGTISIAL